MEYKTYNNLKIPQNLSPEKQALVDEIARKYAAKNREIEADNLKNMGRIALGTLISGASALPIFNIPYVGTGVGGAMYDAGQAIVEGDKLGDIAKRAGRGFAIGETVGAVPYVGKAAGKTKAGQAVGEAASKLGAKIAANPTVQKAYDALMTDVKAFNPNKQTAYHGSPYDFEKFTNEAIGTGEGAQAHGMGHYAALDKGVADKRYRQRQLRTVEEREVDSKYKPLFDEEQKKFDAKSRELYDLRFKDNKLSEEEYQKSIDDAAKKTYEILDEWHNAINNIDKTKATKETGQLYKLSVPKDDVMLREGATFAEQPKKVQEALENIRDKAIKEKGYKSIDEVRERLNAVSDEYEKIIREQAVPVWEWGSTPASNYQLELSKLERLNNMFDYGESSKNIYDNLVRQLGKEETSKLLNKYGIKGISYNGGIDGEARVIFNPDDIDIVRKYYNQPALKDIYNKFINSGTYASALTNP